LSIAPAERLAALRAALACLAACLAGAAAHAAEPTRLLYAEPLVADGAQHARIAAAGPDTGERWRFSAFGRKFELRLRTHTQLRHEATDVVVQAGEIVGVEGSWVRITRRHGAIIGLLSDGEELFGIEPTDELVAFLDPDLPVPDAGNLIYRLSDLLIDAGSLACGTLPASGTVSAATAARALVSELGELQAAAVSPVQRIQLAPVADATFASRFGAEAQSALLGRLNIADGIFSEQVGVDIAAGVPDIFSSDSGTYPLDATAASTLLDQVSNYRRDRHAEYGITHLFTGKRLDDGLAGLAWQSALCFRRESAALSTSANLTATLSALVAAHEIGHNFGAPHDAEGGSPCAAQPNTYLMAPRISYNTDFSPCSLALIETLIAERIGSYPSCLLPLVQTDMAMITPTEVSGPLNESVPVTVVAQNLGAQPATAVNLRLTTPAALAITAASTEDGSCALLADGASCDIASLDTEVNWRVNLQARSSEARSYRVTARVTVAGDQRTSNDSTEFTVTLGSPEQVAGSGGGGGGADGAAVALLVFATAVRHRLRRGTLTEPIP
jgi:hypothetical protein